MKLNIVYFAALREVIGQGREIVESDATDIPMLIDELRARSDAHAHAFSDLTALRCALDQQLTSIDAALGDASEIAFFPPMTGG